MRLPIKLIIPTKIPIKLGFFFSGACMIFALLPITLSPLVFTLPCILTEESYELFLFNACTFAYSCVPFCINITVNSRT